ncbi:DUF4007 family protein [Craurococcus roseus]|uniref:DUF4007 family protein n=1 Tax=Craurococcus roseus TaxID=77585 RepID=A0ABN1EVY0_9PROT
MPQSLLDAEGFRPQFAGHETFPLRHGWLKRAVDAVRADPEARPFQSEDAIAAFGVGKNMVGSIRHWSLACGVLQEAVEAPDKSGRYRLTGFGEAVYSPRGDVYSEHPATIWLFHWHVAAFPGRATAWYWLFSEFHEPDFDRDRLRAALARSLGEAGLGERVAAKTLQRDVECLLRCYAPRVPPGGAREEHVECPFADLGLLAATGGRDGYAFRRGPKRTLPDEAVLHAAMGFWNRVRPDARTVPLEALAHEPGGPGRVFQLDEASLAGSLSRLPALTGGAVRFSEAGGLRQLACAEPSAVDTLAPLRALYRRELHGAGGRAAA